jgi:4-diphosphocytidyl-2-C-methyl-D-erythritol kinase
MAMARTLGADVPVCIHCATTRMQGTGEILNPLRNFPETPIVLVYPGRASQTANVFKRYRGDFKEDLMMPDRFDHVRSLADFLKNTANDLHKAASEGVPGIDNAINALRLRDGCLLSRMSGSGSACFGLFEDENLAEKAAAEISESNPDWWVRAGWLGRPERY